MENIKKNQGKRNRRVGFDLERRITKRFRDSGYGYAKTSRQASRLLDDSKVDIAFVPFLVQCKKGYKHGLNYTNIILEIKQKIKENFPPDSKEHNYPCLIFHDKDKGSENKLVIMEEIFFWELLKEYKYGKN